MKAVSNWKEYPLGELAQYINGKAFKPEHWGKFGLPIIRIQNLTDPSKAFNYFDGDIENRYLIDSGDLLISWSATLGSFIWNSGPAVLNQHIFKVIPHGYLVDKEFLHYLVLTTLDEMAKHSHGLAMKHITKKKFEALAVSIPPLNEQHRIVAHIKECMGRVEEIERLRAETVSEGVAALPSMLNEAFIDLGKNHGKVEVADVALETRYGTSRKCSSTPKGTAILRIPNVVDGFVNFSNLKYCEMDSNEREKIGLKAGDLLFVRTNGSRELVGRCAIYEGNDDDQDYGFASYLIRVRLNQKKIRPHFLAFFLNSSQGRLELDKRRRTSAGQFNINSENLRNIKIPLPPIDTQEKVAAFLSVRQKQVIHLQEELRSAQNAELLLRESILRKAFAGEL